MLHRTSSPIRKGIRKPIDHMDEGAGHAAVHRTRGTKRRAIGVRTLEQRGRGRRRDLFGEMEFMGAETHALPGAGQRRDLAIAEPAPGGAAKLVATGSSPAISCPAPSPSISAAPSTI